MSILSDPGPCPVCGAAHTMCTASPGPTLVTQLPLRDGGYRPSTPPLVADVVQTTLPPGTFTSGTYRRPKK